VKYELNVPEFQGFSDCPDYITLKSHELVSARAVALAVLEATKAINLFEYQDTWAEVWNGRKAVPARGNTPAVAAITGLMTLLLAEREERNPRLDEDQIKDLAYVVIEECSTGTVEKNQEKFSQTAGTVFKDDQFYCAYSKIAGYSDVVKQRFLQRFFKAVDFELLKPGKGSVGIESSHFKVTEDDLKALCGIAKVKESEAERMFSNARRLSEVSTEEHLRESENE
jgi:hypothetical protein